jgi:hypothetical protein
MIKLVEGRLKICLPFVILFGCAMFAGCATGGVTTGAFTQVSLVDKELRRGVSTKMDAQRILGAPNGFGGALFPTDTHQQEVWYYDDIEATDYKGGPDGVMEVKVRQQILLVFFKGGLYDGFMWYSNKVAAKQE